MANFDYSDLITDNNSIPNGLAAGVMRNSMENKNLLNEKGSLYAGTGTTTAIQDGVGNTYTIPNTEAVPPATGAGQVLMSDDDAPTGMSWQSTVSNANNVTAQINGQNISDIFESDGVTVKNATNASQLGGRTASKYALKSDIKGISSTKKGVYPYEWETKTWSGLTSFSGNNIWTDGENIYWSLGMSHGVLNRETSTWETKTWSGLTSFSGNNIWTDGENIYYSSGASQYVLNRGFSTWREKVWNGILASFNGTNIWTDGENIYYSSDANQYVLNREASIWVPKTWSGLTSFSGNNIWTDGENIYYSSGASQYVLTRGSSRWETKTWNGILASFSGNNIWTDGENIYYSSDANQYVLNRETSTWETKTWSELTSFNGTNIWTDGENIYYSSGPTSQYVLSKVISTTQTVVGQSSIYATQNANNVTTQINGQNISDIFESDGVTVKKATSLSNEVKMVPDFPKYLQGFYSLIGKKSANNDTTKWGLLDALHIVRTASASNYYDFDITMFLDAGVEVSISSWGGIANFLYANRKVYPAFGRMNGKTVISLNSTGDRGDIVFQFSDGTAITRQGAGDWSTTVASIEMDMIIPFINTSDLV